MPARQMRNLGGRPACFLTRKASKPFSSAVFTHEVMVFLLSAQYWLRKEGLRPPRTRLTSSTLCRNFASSVVLINICPSARSWHGSVYIDGWAWIQSSWPHYTLLTGPFESTIIYVVYYNSHIFLLLILN